MYEIIFFGKFSINNKFKEIIKIPDIIYDPNVFLELKSLCY